jgi:ribosomal-protein-alanine N-acetyltransferase
MRAAGHGDLAGLAAMERELFGAGAWSEASLRGTLEAADSGLWVAEGPDGLLGYVVLRRAADEAELLRVGVRPRARRAGLASALLELGLGWAAGAGATRIFLEVSSRNTDALAFYLQRGFERIGRRQAYYGPGDDALLLARPIAPSGG